MSDRMTCDTMSQVLCGNSLRPTVLNPAEEIRPHQGVEQDRKVAVSWKTEKETTAFNLAKNSSN